MFFFFFLCSSPNAPYTVFSLSEVLFGSQLCAVSWQTLVNPLAFAGPKLRLFAQCPGQNVQEIWVPEARGFWILGVQSTLCSPCI